MSIIEEAKIFYINTVNNPKYEQYVWFGNVEHIYENIIKKATTPEDVLNALKLIPFKITYSSCVH